MLKRRWLADQASAGLSDRAYMFYTGLKLYRLLYFFRLRPYHTQGLYHYEGEEIIFHDEQYLTIYTDWLKVDLERILSICERAGARLIILAYHVGHHAYEIQRDFCDDHSVPFIDTPSLERDPDTGKHTFQRRMWHPLHKEYKKIALWVGEFLERKGLLSNH